MSNNFKELHIDFSYDTKTPVEWKEDIVKILEKTMKDKLRELTGASWSGNSVHVEAC